MNVVMAWPACRARHYITVWFVAIKGIGEAASTLSSGDRIESVLDFGKRSLIIGRSCCSETFAINLACFVEVTGPRKDLAEMIVRSDIAWIATDYFSKLENRISVVAFLLELKRQRVARERITGIGSNELLELLSSTTHLS